jgi:AcrR family transcriptional regulator
MRCGGEAVAQKGKPMKHRSEVTKAAILAAAREQFAAAGYERATIRTIAADAKIDPAMVMRYFSNKETLFAAAAEFDLRLPDLSAVPRGTLGSVLVGHFVDRWESDDTLQALLRAAVSYKVAVTRLRAIFETQLMSAVAPLHGDRARAATRIGLIASQMLGMALCRYVLRLPPVVALDRAAVIQWLAPTIQRYLTGGR